MSNNVTKLRKIAICGVFAAFVFIGTQLRIPTAIGYINLGDAVILIGSFVLGPVAFFPSAIGSALADLIAGYPQYIAPTFIIKGLMGLISGILFIKGDVSVPRKIITGLIAELIMAGGYFVFESLPFMYGVEAALGSVLFNAIQGVAAIIILVPVTAIPALKSKRLR